MALSTFYYSDGSPTTSTDTIISESSYNISLNLTGVNIGDGVTAIADNTFYGLIDLTNVNIPNSVTAIGSEAFNSCGINDLTIPKNLNNNNYNYIFDIFANCINLTKVNIGDGLLKLSETMFANCINLKDIIIPNSVTNIEDGVFYGCTSLTSITIPKNVNNIRRSFYNCTNLIRANFLGNFPSEISDQVFYNTSTNLKIYRYSTKSGWPSTFDGKDVLLIDAPSKGLRTFGFPNISSGKVSIKKQSLTSLKVGGGTTVKFPNPT
jgi:hypothetical protein